MIHIKNKKRELHQRLISMNSLAYSVIFYGIFYGIKQAAFFFSLFSYLIESEFLRIIPSLFFGAFISRAMLNTSVNIEPGKEWVITSIAIFDFMVLCVITDIFNQDNWVTIINLLIFCAFVTYLGYWLNYVFVKKVKQKQEEALIEQNKAITKQNLASIEQNLAESSNQLTELSNSVATKKQELNKLNNEISERSCPFCSEPFPSKKSRDAHKGRCSKKTSNQ